MYTLSLLLLPLAAFTTAVAGEACVVGGPAGRVAGAERCCGLVAGTWFSSYPYQGICVQTEEAQPLYASCVAKFAPNYNLVCIQCDETNDCGLDPTDPTD